MMYAVCRFHYSLQHDVVHSGKYGKQNQLFLLVKDKGNVSPEILKG